MMTSLPVPTAIRSLLAVLRDPNDASHVFRIVDALSGRTPARFRRAWARSASGARLLTERPRLRTVLEDTERLRALPEGSLGRAYLAFMQRDRLDAAYLDHAQAVAGVNHEANVETARAALASAKLDVDRTILRAPFNATITTKAVERGDFVAPGSVVARLVGTDRFVARISVPIEELQLIVRAGEATTAVLTQRLDQHTVIERSATVLRVASELDRDSRTAQVLLGIEDPLDPPEGEQPLLVGAFVTAKIEGPTLERAVEVPRRGLVDGNRLWVLDENDRLVRRTVTIAFGGDETVVVTAGVEPGERIVVTNVPQALEGMRVRVAAAGEDRA